MNYTRRLDDSRLLEPRSRIAEVGERALAAAEEQRHDRNVDFIDQARGENYWLGGAQSGCRPTARLKLLPEIRLRATAS